ncbi:hypothetical protein BC830DRAFT_69413 [Chytriomyces sp. MP71]|nr:hypothetical protein BC830DRAFT_69413 [Chytriomyces sp. MP71]
MLSTLPPELVSAVYQRIPLAIVVKVMRGLSRSHRGFAEQRMLACVEAVHLTLVSDTAHPVFCASLDEFQLPLRLHLDRSRTQGDQDGSLRFEARKSDALFFEKRIHLLRVKALVFEDFAAGGARSVVHNWDSQMGILLEPALSDKGDVEPDRVNAFFENSTEKLLDSLIEQPMPFTPETHASQLSRTTHQTLAHAERFIPSFRNLVELTESRTLHLDWTLFLYPDKADEKAAVLKEVTVPVDLLLRAFLCYTPGLADLDTEDGDSDWVSEDVDSVLDYDDDEYYYDDGDDDMDSGGYASDY